LLGTRGPLTLGGPLDFAYPAYPIVTPLSVGDVLCPLARWSQFSVDEYLCLGSVNSKHYVGRPTTVATAWQPRASMSTSFPPL